MDTLRQAHEEHTQSGFWETYYDIVEVPNGSVELYRCGVCSYIEAICIHEHCKWNDEGDKLTCSYCGLDVT